MIKFCIDKQIGHYELIIACFFWKISSKKALFWGSHTKICWPPHSSHVEKFFSFFLVASLSKMSSESTQFLKLLINPLPNTGAALLCQWQYFEKRCQTNIWQSAIVEVSSKTNIATRIWNFVRNSETARNSYKVEIKKKILHLKNIHLIGWAEPKRLNLSDSRLQSYCQAHQLASTSYK